MADNYGASLEAWHHWSVALGLFEDLLPVVAKPGAKISPGSTIQTLGKTPTRYNFRGEVSGVSKWTEWRSTMRDIGLWEREHDYGICLQTRKVRAIDVDVAAEGQARKIVELIAKAWPLYFMPERYREGTGKTLFLFEMAEPLTKRVVPVAGGMVEILGTGQQCVVDSTYIDAKTGEANGRYLWRGGWPVDIPIVTPAEFELLWDSLRGVATGEVKIARDRRVGSGIDTRPRPGLEDPVAQWLLSQWEVRDEGRGGELYIRCPFDHEHTAYSGPTETAYWLAGTGGYEQGHFKCLHAHCMDRTDADYLDALGYHASAFPDLTDGEQGEDDLGETLPAKSERRFIVDSKGRKEANSYNKVAFLQAPELCGRVIAYDDFTGDVVWYPESKPGQWKAWTDGDYVAMAMAMDRNGFKPVSPAQVRPEVGYVAKHQAVDLAMEWAERLPAWDGVERIARFLPDYLHTLDTAYTRAVGEYIWTAHAGRLLSPGCQADMVPVLVGEQDRRKTTVVQSIAPSMDMFAEISLAHRDDDTSRKLRGALAIELGELQGLKSRQIEDVKAFVTRRFEKWVPKYQELPTTFRRRCLLWGTTNEITGFLTDPTGERRWLPFEVCVDGKSETCEIDRLVDDRNQLWAEGIARWRDGGVRWREAERLAKAEHANFKLHDPWSEPVRAWLLAEDPMRGMAPVDDEYGWGTHEVLVGALGKRAAQLTSGDQIRAGAVLRHLGCWKKRVRGKGWQYRAFRGDLTGGSEEQ